MIKSKEEMLKEIQDYIKDEELFEKIKFYIFNRTECHDCENCGSSYFCGYEEHYCKKDNRLYINEGCPDYINIRDCENAITYAWLNLVNSPVTKTLDLETQIETISNRREDFLERAEKFWKERGKKL